MTVRTRLLLVVVAAGLGSGALAPLAAEVAWRDDFDAVLAEARLSGRPVLLDFWATWCGPCRAMDREIWSRDDVAAAVAEFTLVRIDVDRSPKLALRYHADSIPTMVVADPWGHQVARRTGYTESEELRNLFKVIPRDFRPIDRWNTTLESDAKDGEALLAVGRFYTEHEILDLGSDYFASALKSRRARSDRAFRAAAGVALGWNELKTRQFKPATKDLESALGTPGIESSDRAAALFGLVVAALGRGDRKQAERRLAELEAAFPGSSSVEQARKLMTAGR